MQLSVNCVLQGLTSLELRSLGCCDGDCLFCSRISADSLRSFRYLECTETNQLNLLALNELITYYINKCL